MLPTLGFLMVIQDHPEECYALLSERMQSYRRKPKEERAGATAYGGLMRRSAF
jgi:hypothetical protein